MILAKTEHIETAENVLKSAFYVAEKLGKSFGVLCYTSDNHCVKEATNNVKSFLFSLDLPNENVYILPEKRFSLVDFCEKEEVSFLLIQPCGFSRTNMQKQLNICRNLRIPYVFFRDDFPVFNLKKVLVPVGFLVEEYEKAQFASAFGRFCGSQIHILLANDYGSKAATTSEKMKQLFGKFNLNFTESKAVSDSFKLDKETVSKAKTENFDIVLISASRDYGLDDVIFGPKELHLVRNSQVPLLLVNPRGDLYTLCD